VLSLSRSLSLYVYSLSTQVVKRVDRGSYGVGLYARGMNEWWLMCWSRRGARFDTICGVVSRHEAEVGGKVEGVLGEKSRSPPAKSRGEAPLEICGRSRKARHKCGTKKSRSWMHLGFGSQWSKAFGYFLWLNHLALYIISVEKKSKIDKFNSEK